MFNTDAKKNQNNNITHLNIIFRCCIPVHSVRGGNRPFDATKREVVLCCLESLLHSITDDCTIHILDDHSEKSDVEKMKGMLLKNSKRHQFIALKDTGNGESLDACFQLARDKDFELTYFCEDDYLHSPEAITSMLTFYRGFHQDCIIHPTDYIDRYLRDKPYDSLIYLGSDRHWRTIKHTTGTFMISQRVLKKYWKLYMAFAQSNKKVSGGHEDETINKIYQKEICLSPIPSLAAHFSPFPEMPHFVDWKSLYLKLKKGIE